MSPRRGSLAFRLGASAVVLAGFLGVAEVASRAIGPEIPAWRALDKPGTLLVGHDTRLWGIAPGVAGNGLGQATVDPIGLRSPIPERPRPEGVERVLIVGDSSIFGHGVPDDQTLSVHLGTALRERGVDVDTVNGGIPGYSTEQTLALLDEVGWDVEPTLLVIANLWSDNNFDVWHDRDLLHTAKVFHQNPLRRSALYTLLASSIDRLRGGSGARVITWTRTSGAPSGDVVRRVPLHDYARNLDTLARQAAERGVGVAFLGLANRDLVAKTFDEGSWDIYIQTQTAVAEHHGAVRVEAQGALQEALDQGATLDDLFVDELHPSGPAHARIAEALADGLVGAGWPADPQLGSLESAFDPTGLTDAWHTQVEVAGGRGSPQQQLIDGAEVPVSAGTPDGGKVEGGRVEGGKVDDARPTPDVPPASAPDWWVEGEVQTDAPGGVLVELKVDGQVLSSARLRKAGPYRLQVRGNQDAVQVVATDANGDQESGSADRDEPRRDLDLR